MFNNICVIKERGFIYIINFIKIINPNAVRFAIFYY